MLAHKRRKKRPQHGLRTVELQRGKQGYGFTISGQQPCYISRVTSGSPADTQGIQERDQIITVNGLAVAQLTHEQIVKVIGSSSGILKLQIAEYGRTATAAGHMDSDSSDEEYVKPRYMQRTRTKSATRSSHNNAATGAAHESNVKKSGATMKHDELRHASNSVAKQQGHSLPPRQTLPDDFPTIYNPMRAINGRASDFGVIRQQSQQEHRIGDYYRPGLTSRGQLLPGYGQLHRSNSEPDVTSTQAQTTAQGLSKLLYPAMQPMTISSSSTINADDDQPSLKVIVGYIGSIEMPQDSNLPNSRLQSIRSAVRRLRVEQKVHTLVLLEMRSDGIKLMKPGGSTIAYYTVSRLAMSGMYPDDKRFFGLVTTQERDPDEDPESPLSSSCHVFMVDPEFSTHSIHAAKAKLFGVHCTIDPSSQRCLEFPKSCSPILRTAARLYRDRHGGIFDAPRRNERHASSDNDTNSDSGLGFHKDQDEGVNDRLYVVDIHIPDNSLELSPSHSTDRVLSPVRGSGLQRSQTPIKASPVGLRDQHSTSNGANNAMLSTDTFHGTTAVTNSQIRSSPVTNSVKVTGRVFDIRATSNTKPTPQLTAAAAVSSAARATPVSAISPAAITQSPLDPRTVEQLRVNMQKLLAKRRENVRDTQSLSDTESVLSDVHSSKGSSRSKHLSINSRGAVGGMSSGSESSSSFLARKELQSFKPSVHLYSEQSVRAKPVYISETDPSADIITTPKSKSAHPPTVPPKPVTAARRAMEDYNRHQQALISRRQRQQMALNEYERSESPPYSQKHSCLPAHTSVSDPLGSKLSPRAYPSVASKPVLKVETSERSAFQKVSPESVIPSHQQQYYSRDYEDYQQIQYQQQGQGHSLNFYHNAMRRNNQHHFNHNNNNNNNQPGSASGADGGGDHHSKCSEKQSTQRSRPVPAPRRLDSHEGKPSIPARSCSVPPNASARLPIWHARELNVDDGLSVRSESTQSLESQYRQSLNGRNGFYGLNGSYYEQQKSVSSESLVDVGHARHVEKLSVARDPRKTPTLTNNNVGRVASWAVSFENLLQDPEGVEAFTEFLKKEYSEENIEFWLACQEYKSIRPLAERKEKASQIYQTYLSKHAPEPVNIDSHAMKIAEGQLNSPSPSIFDEAQQQVFTLMKTDSYSRFIKSEFYQSYLMREFEHDYNIHHSYKSKSKSSIGSDVSDSDNQKKRGLPGFFKDLSRSIGSSKPSVNIEPSSAVGSSSATAVASGGTLHKTWSRSSDDSSLERGRTSAVNKSRRYEGSLTADLSAIKYRIESSNEDSDADEKLIRVVLPDGSTSVMQARHSDSLRSILATLLSRKSDLTIAAIDVFPLDTDKAIDISLPVSDLPCEELRVEKRALFRLDLPNRKSVGVKAKPQRTIRDVLRPILKKYGYNIENIVITQGADTINHDGLVSTIDNLRLTITTKEEYTGKAKKEWGISTRKNPNKELVKDCDDVVDFESSTNLDTTTTTKKSKGSQLLGMLKNHSLDEFRGTLKKPKNKVVTFGPTKSLDDRVLSKSKTDEGFLEMITKAQSSRFDDQRGIGVDVGELPDFLKSTNSSSDQQSETDEGGAATSNTRSNITGAPSLNFSFNSTNYTDRQSLNSVESDQNTDTHQSKHITQTTPQSSAKLNRSYQNAIESEDSKHFNFEQQTPDANRTLTAFNNTLENTLTPGKMPLSPLPTNLPPPPQFGNEALTSTPQHPPPYKEALNRSSLVSSFNSSSNSSGGSNNSNNNNNINALPELTTIPGNNPGNRLSYAHHQPIIFNDDDRSSVIEADRRSIPSPTTHHLVLSTEEQIIEEEPSEQESYGFYESLSLSRQRQPNHNSEVKVTFV